MLMDERTTSNTTSLDFSLLASHVFAALTLVKLFTNLLDLELRQRNAVVQPRDQLLQLAMERLCLGHAPGRDLRVLAAACTQLVVQHMSVRTTQLTITKRTPLIV